MEPGNNTLLCQMNEAHDHAMCFLIFIGPINKLSLFEVLFVMESAILQPGHGCTGPCGSVVCMCTVVAALTD